VLFLGLGLDKAMFRVLVWAKVRVRVMVRFVASARARASVGFMNTTMVRNRVCLGLK
jgi:hypothetical protein